MRNSSNRTYFHHQFGLLEGAGSPTGSFSEQDPQSQDKRLSACASGNRIKPDHSLRIVNIVSWNNKINTSEHTHPRLMQPQKLWQQVDRSLSIYGRQYID